MENLFISSSFQDFCINLFPGKKSLFCFSYLVVGGVCVGGGGGTLCVYVCVCVYHKVSFHKTVSFNVHFVD